MLSKDKQSLLINDELQGIFKINLHNKSIFMDKYYIIAHEFRKSNTVHHYMLCKRQRLAVCVRTGLNY